MDYAKLMIFDKGWNKIGYIDSYKSLIWTKRYTSYGEFELYIPFSKRFTKILECDNFVVIDESYTPGYYAMIIDRVEIVQSPNDPVMMIVKGKSLESILYRRIFYESIITGYDTVALSRFGFISNIIDNCFGVNIVTPPRRWSTDGKTNDYAIYNSTGDDTIDNRVKTVTKGDNLGDTLDKFLKSVGYGIDVLYANDNIYNIYIYKGTDRSDSVTFRSDLDNLKNCTYIKDISNVSNVARITSMDSTATVPTYADGTSAPDEIRGINRREIKFSSGPYWRK